MNTSKLAKLTYTQAYDLISSNINNHIILGQYHDMKQEALDRIRSVGTSVVKVSKDKPSHSQHNTNAIHLQAIADFYDELISRVKQDIELTTQLMTLAEEKMAKTDFDKLYSIYSEERFVMNWAFQPKEAVEFSDRKNYKHAIIIDLMNEIYKQDMAETIF